MSHLGHFLSSGVGDLLPHNLLRGFWLLDKMYFFSLFFTWVGGIRLLEVDDEEREEDAEEGAGGK